MGSEKTPPWWSALLQQSDGGPAFPQQGGLIVTMPGMSLRDYFAGQALTAIGAIDITDDKIAEACYAIADAMLRERRGGGT